MLECLCFPFLLETPLRKLYFWSHNFMPCRPRYPVSQSRESLITGNTKIPIKHDQKICWYTDVVYPTLFYNLTLCDPVDCSLPGFSILGILQARILEWVTISFSRGSSQLRDRTRVSHIVGKRFTIWATKLCYKTPYQILSGWDT